MCESYNYHYGAINGVDYRNVMLTNLRLLPGLIRRFHEAKMASLPEVLIWGSGKPKR